jgi:hypothetical protein
MIAWEKYKLERRQRLTEAELKERLGPDDPACDHQHYQWAKHGRRCTCGTLMDDPGD